MKRSWGAVLFALCLIAGSTLHAEVVRACGGAFAYRPPKSASSVPKLVSDGSEVALMREGTTTVVSLSMRYRGPAEDFAVVVPVPVVLKKDDVRTLSPSVFERLRQMSGPRLVEQWEVDPCHRDVASDDREGGTGTRSAAPEESMGGTPRAAPAAVTVEARFAVDEYEIVILGASDAVALEAWLSRAGYELPAGIEPFLRPYVAEGYKFFVAKVDVEKVALAWGRAQLSPLRFHFDDPRFALPIRLGLANVEGKQDLTIYLLAKDRYDVASYDNVFIPTNLRFVEGVADRFGAIYEQLKSDTVEKNPRAVVTEHVARADRCGAACRGLEHEQALADLGGDVTQLKPEDLVLTRLFARYDASFDRDFVFRKAPPVRGGDETVDDTLPTEQGHEASENSFHARYFIRYPWRGDITCWHAERGRWSGDDTRPQSQPAADGAPLTDLLFVAEPEPLVPHQAWLLLAPLSSHDGRALLLPLAVLLLALGLQTRRLHKLSIGVLRPAALTVAVSVSPGLLLLHDRSRYDVAESPLPMVQLCALAIASALLVSWTSERRHGRNVSLAWCTAVALVPLLLGLSSMVWQLFQATDFLTDVAPSLYPIAMAVTEAEASHGLVMGSVWSTLLLAVVAWSCASSPGDAEGAPVSVGLGVWIAAFLLGLAGVGLAYGFVFRPLRIWPWVAVCWILPAIWLSSYKLATAPLSRPERYRRSLAITGLALTMMLLAVIAHQAWHFYFGVGAIAGRSVEHWQRQRILDETFAEAATLLRFAPLAVLLPAALPIYLVWKSGRGSLRPIAVRGALPPALAIALAAGLWAATRVQIARALAPSSRAATARLQPPGVLPYARIDGRAWRFDTTLTGAAFLVDSEGRLFGSSAEGESASPINDALYARMSAATVNDPRDPLLVADEKLTVGDLRRGLGPMLARGHRGFRLVIGRGPTPAPGKGLYALAYEGYDQRATADVTWHARLPLAEDYALNHRGAGAIALRAVDDDQLEAVALLGIDRLQRHMHRLTVRLARPAAGARFDDAPFDALLSRDLTKAYVLCLKNSDTVARVSELILSLSDEHPPWQEWDPNFHNWEEFHPLPRIILTTDQAPFAEDPL